MLRMGARIMPVRDRNWASYLVGVIFEFGDNFFCLLEFLHRELLVEENGRECNDLCARQRGFTKGSTYCRYLSNVSCSG